MQGIIFCISDDGIKSITLNCTKLKQLSLWGCLKLRKLYFDEEEEENALDPSTEALSIKTIFWDCSNVACLNLWGCHVLNDSIINSMIYFKHLKQL